MVWQQQVVLTSQKSPIISPLRKGG